MTLAARRLERHLADWQRAQGVLPNGSKAAAAWLVEAIDRLMHLWAFFELDAVPSDPTKQRLHLVERMASTTDKTIKLARAGGIPEVVATSIALFTILPLHLADAMTHLERRFPGLGCTGKKTARRAAPRGARGGGQQARGDRARGA